MGLKEHHAYLVPGKWSEMRKALTERVEQEFNITLHRSPDYWLGEYGTMGIDDARVLAEQQTRKAVDKGVKVFIIAFDFITSEAQNALLKVFEEPTPRTHFFVVTPIADAFLPTLRSRLAPLRVTNDQQPTTDNKTKEFLQGNMQARLKVIEPIVEEKDKAGALALLDGVERELHSGGTTALTDAEILFALRELEVMRGYLRDRAPSVKMILEYVTLMIPKL